MKFALISQRRQIGNFGRHVNSLEESYLQFFNRFNVNLIPVSSAQTEKGIYHLFNLNPQLVILSGGGDALPNELGSSHYSSEREQLEQLLIKIAISKGIPLLGICKGMHTLNLFFGGGLKHLSNNHHINQNHIIYSCRGSQSHLIFKQDHYVVNSYHQSYIDNECLASDLIPLAHHDTVIEAFVHNVLKIVGVQWHPERYIDSGIHNIDREIFNYLFI